MDASVASLVLEDKREKAEEFFINLFELCNLRCAFCWQDHESRAGMETVVEKSYDVIRVVKQKLPRRRAFEINVMGGELFFDEIPDGLFEDYFEFAKNIQDFANEAEVEVSFNWVTNLVFGKTARVKTLMRRLEEAGIDACLTSSYDPRGRFNKRSYELFQRNLTLFKDELRNISVVMTKPNILAIQKGDARLEELADKFPLYFDYYSPEDNYQAMLPTDAELLDFFKYMLEKYPQAQPFKSWRENSRNKMTCRSSNVILPSGESGKCRSLLGKETKSLFETPVDIKDNSNMEERFVQKRNCLECEYFKKCGLGCFLQTDFKGHNVLDDCLFYKTFRHIEEGG